MIQNTELPSYVKVQENVRRQLHPEHWIWTIDHRSCINATTYTEACNYDNIVQFHIPLSMGTAAARGTRKLIDDTVAYWEIHTQTYGSSMMFGIGQEDAKMRQPVFYSDILGINEKSMGINYKGMIQRNGIKIRYMPRLSGEFDNLKIGLLFDGPTQTLSLYHHDTFKGVLFGNIDTSVPWYPMVSSTSQNSVFTAVKCFSNANNHVITPKSLMQCAMEATKKRNFKELMPKDFKIPKAIQQECNKRQKRYEYGIQKKLRCCTETVCPCKNRRQFFKERFDVYSALFQNRFY